jgi:hypothetical protein
MFTRPFLNTPYFEKAVSYRLERTSTGKQQAGLLSVSPLTGKRPIDPVSLIRL